MGKYDDAMYSYLSDNGRFADLFNGVLFGGRPVVRAETLEDASERYVDAVLQKDDRERIRYERGVRDIRKRAGTGECYIVTAVENQNDIDYAMPWRIMRYDQMEYGRQIRDIVSRRQISLKEEGRSAGNWRKRLQKEDRLRPVYTICFYHGTERWDGPRSLRDMMWFGEKNEDWQKVFHDYGMTLFCAEEWNDLSCFGTDLRHLLEVLQMRQDKEGLLRLWSGEAYSHLDRETVETMAVMTDSVEILKRLEANEEGGCNMCLAVEEMRRDWKAEGEAKGIVELGTELGLSEQEILSRLQSRLHVPVQTAQEYLRAFGQITV